MWTPREIFGHQRLRCADPVKKAFSPQKLCASSAVLSGTTRAACCHGGNVNLIPR